MWSSNGTKIVYRPITANHNMHIAFSGTCKPPTGALFTYGIEICWEMCLHIYVRHHQYVFKILITFLLDVDVANFFIRIS